MLRDYLADGNPVMDHKLPDPKEGIAEQAKKQASSAHPEEKNQEDWEEIEHKIIADNTGGLLMQRGMVDMCIVGTDRVSENGDVANKIGTYLKALAAKDNNIPFYVALPSTTYDKKILKGKDIPIEERSDDELKLINGFDQDGKLKQINIYPKNSKGFNLGFDITPAELVTGFITEKGIFKPEELRENF